MCTFAEIKRALSESMNEDLEWLMHGRVPGEKPDPIHNPWMPFQMADFIAIMSECVAVAPGCRFLDVGSGPGSKVEVADRLFGMLSVGLERDQKMAYHALGQGRATVIGDALDYPNYDRFDIIWMYRPFKDVLQQQKLEHKIYGEMKPGAIIAGGALCSPPPGFEIVVDDWDVGCRGAWKKPLNWEPASYEIEDE